MPEPAKNLYHFSKDTCISVYLSLLLFLAALYTSILHYLYEIRPWITRLEPNIGYKPSSVFFPADSYVYWKFGTYVDFLEVPKNIFGPVLLGKLLLMSPDLIFLFNMVCFLLALFTFSAARKLNFYSTSALVLVQPIIFSQVFFINKEIYMIIASFFYLAYLKAPKKTVLAMAIVMTLFTKTEFILLVFGWFCIRNVPNRLFYAIIAVIISVISLVYNRIPGIEAKYGVLVAGQNESSLGVNLMLHEMASEYYLFVVTIIPRISNSILTGVIGLFKNPQAFGDGLLEITSGIVFTFLMCRAFFRKNPLQLSSEHYFVILWCVAIATIPFSVHRYLLPCYPFLFSIYLCREETSLKAD